MLGSPDSFRRQRSGSTTQVIEKLGCRGNARDKQMIPRSRARDVQQVTLGVVHLLQIGVVAHRANNNEQQTTEGAN